MVICGGCPQVTGERGRRSAYFVAGVLNEFRFPGARAPKCSEALCAVSADDSDVLRVSDSALWQSVWYQLDVLPCFQCSRYGSAGALRQDVVAIAASFCVMEQNSTARGRDCEFVADPVSRKQVASLLEDGTDMESKLHEAIDAKVHRLQNTGGVALYSKVWCLDR